MLIPRTPRAYRGGFHGDNKQAPISMNMNKEQESSGDYIVRCVNNTGEEKDLRINCAEFDAISCPAERVLCIHKKHGVFTGGEPFSLLWIIQEKTMEDMGKIFDRIETLLERSAK